jgi:hypothetical protein
MFDFNKESEYVMERKEEFERRAQDMPDLPIPGDRVVLHAGLLHRGHMWIRIEGKCVEVGEMSAKVAFNHHGRDHMEWVHPAVITDNLGQTPKE